MRKIAALSMIVIVICSILVGCGSTSKLEGNWVCEEVNSGYPDQMTLKGDGTGTADGFSCNWSVSGDQMTITVGSAWIGTLTYEYSISGSTLYLDGYGYTKQ